MTWFWSIQTYRPLGPLGRKQHLRETFYERVQMKADLKKRSPFFEASNQLSYEDVYVKITCNLWSVGTLVTHCNCNGDTSVINSQSYGNWDVFWPACSRLQRNHPRYWPSVNGIHHPPVTGGFFVFHQCFPRRKRPIIRKAIPCHAVFMADSFCHAVLLKFNRLYFN